MLYYCFRNSTVSVKSKGIETVSEDGYESDNGAFEDNETAIDEMSDYVNDN